MALYKNKASQKLAVYAHDTAADAPKTGDAANITARISLNGGSTAATNDVNPTELDATNAPGVYIFDLTTAETNADLIIVFPKSATADVQIEPVIVYTEPEIRSANAVQISGDSGAADNMEACFDGNYGTIYADLDGAVGSVLFVDAGAITASSIASNAITSAKIADNAITAAKIAADAITDAKVASDVTIASVTGAVGSVTGNVGGNVVGSVGSVTGNVGGNVTGSVGSISGITFPDNFSAMLISGTTGAVQADLRRINGNTPPVSLLEGALTGTNAIYANVVMANGDDVVVTNLVEMLDGTGGTLYANISGDLTGSVGTVGGQTLSNLDVAISTRLAASSYTAPDNSTISTINGKLPSSTSDTLTSLAAMISSNAFTSDALANAPTADVPTVEDIRAEIDANSTQLAAIDSALEAVDTVVDAIQAKTDNLTFTVSGKVDSTPTHSVLTSLTSMISSNKFTAAALENAPAGEGGGGSGDIIVAPIVATANPSFYATENLPSIAQGSAPTLIFACVDSEGTPIDLSGKDLRFVVSRHPEADAAVSFVRETDDGITIGGDDNNTVSVELTTDNTASVLSGYYHLWNTTDSILLSRGTISIDAAKKSGT